MQNALVAMPLTFSVTLGAATCDFWSWASHSAHLATQKLVKSLAEFQEFVALYTQPEHRVDQAIAVALQRKHCAQETMIRVLWVSYVFELP